MAEVTVTLVGRIGQPPALRTGTRGDWASFTLATNPRYKQGDTWVDGPTSWFGVKADGDLGHHVVASLVKGQQVIVHGTLSVRESVQQDGTKSKFVDVQASAIGPDLRWGTTTFTRADRPPQRQEQQLQAAPQQTQDDGWRPPGTAETTPAANSWSPEPEYAGDAPF